MQKATFKKAKPFGAHNMTRLSNVNSKLVCALSTVSCDCWEDCGGDVPYPQAERSSAFIQP